MNKDIQRTPLHQRHVDAGARMVYFAGWEMPLHYPGGIIHEHLSTREGAGLFDVSHMGRAVLTASSSRQLLQHLLSNDLESLPVGRAQYTLVPDEHGEVIDDAYLYRFHASEYLLVVNAANSARALRRLYARGQSFNRALLENLTRETGMLSLQGPRSEEILGGLVADGGLPAEGRNSLSTTQMGGADVQIGRTGYTGEPLCFELMVDAEAVGDVWDALVAAGATPVGLGARDTLRLEAGLPLHGHEFGQAPEGGEIPAMAVRSARAAISFARTKGAYVGREVFQRQREAFSRIRAGDFSDVEALPRLIQPLAVFGRGVARHGSRVFRGDRQVGAITSGTMAPYRKEGQDVHAVRAVCLALVDCDVRPGEPLTVEVRGRRVEAACVKRHLAVYDTHTRPVLHEAAPGQT
jgi:aminomethyltransferase